MSMTETQLEVANQEADRGNYDAALPLLDEAWRLAVSTDRPWLRARVAISRANVLFYVGRRDEAVALWEHAEKEAAEAGDAALAAGARIYRLRSRLSSESEATDAEIAEIYAAVQAEMKNVKSDKLFTALAWSVSGLAQKGLGQFAEAEKSLRNSLSIHEDARYLEQAGYDWYLIASVRSVAGDYPGAQAALDSALGFDRRAENSFALGMDWAAKGDVFSKSGDREAAVEAWRRSAEIFRSISLEKQAQDAENRIFK
jgi:tetratricopeptide (TPR) repeat protein